MQSTTSQNELTGMIHGKVIYLLALIVLVQTIYPITQSNSPAMVMLYQVMYMSLMVAGFVVARETPIYSRILIGLGVLWGVVGTIYAFNQEAVWAQLAGYVVIVAFQGMVTKVLLEFVLTAKNVTRDVIYAATAIYFLLGALFVPIYGIIETVTYSATGAHAFSDPVVAVGQVFPWQSFIYYSYATLTTLGYGDVLPVTMLARSIASLQAVIGVLYTAIIMARLVGLYASERNDSNANPENSVVEQDEIEQER